MMVNNCEEFRPCDGPEQGSRWTLVFYGASNALGNGIGVVLISPEGCHTPFTLDFYLENEELSVQGDDWKSFLEVQGCFFNAYFVLKLLVSSCGTSTAKGKIKNGGNC
ncbi:unnamed protein product [Vicia faba]|uniref:Uncharacterized protein n=1 Tax=Vicia faba TaxID=3906 RepID=A0AAV0ZKT9_VICFA|nr:unnamed protein product [Vicia faba]